MREILFKAKRIDNGEWVEGCLVTRKIDGTDTIIEAHIIKDAYEQLGVMNFGMQPVLISPLADEYTDGCFRVDKDTICQYTGLTDKNGNKIWENDVIGYWDTYSTENGLSEADCVGTVLWDDETLSFQVTERLSAESYEVMDECSVIGNTFDNPDLLKRE